MTERFFRLQEVAEVSGCSTTDVENWVKRLPLRCSTGRSSRGRKRLFSTIETMELAFLAALTKSGVAPSVGCTLAAKWVNRSQHIERTDYFAIPDGAVSSGKEMSADAIAQTFDDSYPPDPSGPFGLARSVIALIAVGCVKWRVLNYHDALRSRIKAREQERGFVFPPDWVPDEE